MIVYYCGDYVKRGLISITSRKINVQCVSKIGGFGLFFDIKQEEREREERERKKKVE